MLFYYIVCCAAITATIAPIQRQPYHIHCQVTYAPAAELFHSLCLLFFLSSSSSSLPPPLLFSLPLALSLSLSPSLIVTSAFLSFFLSISPFSLLHSSLFSHVQLDTDTTLTFGSSYVNSLLHYWLKALCYPAAFLTFTSTAVSCAFQSISKWRPWYVHFFTTCLWLCHSMTLLSNCFSFHS